jgi:hypothetical protein
MELRNWNREGWREYERGRREKDRMRNLALQYSGKR